jgi:glycosyltransferase involved in cell wall biosynthesis
MKITVLLSSWNGERYLREQIASLLAQEVEGILEILIRDDGSGDNTVKIAEEMNDGRIRVIQGENLGARGSFLALLDEAARSTADYVALADQDDVWLPDKLQRAVSRLSKFQGPSLYCSALNLVDEQLQSLGLYQSIGTPSFEASFLNNSVTGCTCVINRGMLDVLVAKPIAEKIIMHDWWLYIVASAFGTVVYDRESFILYRQHSMNQVGMRIGFSGLLYRIKRFSKRSATTTRLTQAREFQRIYGHRLSISKKAYLAQLLACEESRLRRLGFVITRRPRRNSFFAEVVSSITFLLGR